MKRPRVLASALIVFSLAAAAMVLPGVLFPDASAPSTIAPYVAGARSELSSNLNDHEIRPFHLRFIRAECRAEGGAVLLFEQRMFPYLDVAYAYTLTGDWPPYGWSGGANLSEPYDDEIATFLGESAVPCR